MLRRTMGSALIILGGGLSTVVTAEPPGARGFVEEVVWARNIGGPAIETRAGERFGADRCDEPGVAGRCERVAEVLRTQDEALFRSLRSGDQCFGIPLASGRYDLSLFFTEPDGRLGVRRVFDVEVEGLRLLSNFAVDEKPPGEARFALSRAFPEVEVNDGALDVCLASRKGDAVISGLLVRRSSFSTQGWDLVWGDEFSDPATLHDTWTAEEWQPGRVNGEAQAYTAQARNVRVEDGVLILEAHATGTEAPAFTSGRVHSWGQRAFRYGRLDIRARVPEGRGVWPALWLLPDDPYRHASTCYSDRREWPDDDDCDAWPNSGEIDLMEHVGYETGLVHGTVHTRDFYARLGNQVQGTIVVPDLGVAFHTYSLVWAEGELAMYVDGVRYFAYFDDGRGFGQWPFDHAFHIVMNLAVGGDWNAAYGPVESAVMPRRLEVDFVRLYRRASADALAAAKAAIAPEALTRSPGNQFMRRP
ncbi:MAG: family 16 glycosylhydrolase [Halieaceae bacterium]|jgi:beta-glucanase (GH16 family)|nr:family 16 glycosylhydrolase [Halieaceae bacterium]